MPLFANASFRVEADEQGNQCSLQQGFQLAVIGSREGAEKDILCEHWTPQ